MPWITRMELTRNPVVHHNMDHIGPRSSGDRAPASGAGCTGSNPVEGMIASATSHGWFLRKGGRFFFVGILARSL